VQSRLSKVDRCRKGICAPKDSASLCDHCVVSGLLLAVLKAATGVLNHITMATCAIAGIS